MLETFCDKDVHIEFILAMELQRTITNVFQDCFFVKILLDLTVGWVVHFVPFARLRAIIFLNRCKRGVKVTVELLLLITAVFGTSPLFCSVPSGARLAEIFSVKPQSSFFNAKVVKERNQFEQGEGKPLAIVKHRHVLAIFVHGTLFPVPNLTAVQEWAGERLKKDGHPLGYIDLLRDKGVLRHQPIGPIGLHPVAPSWSPTANGAQLLGWLMQEMYGLLPSEERAIVYPYTFGWDGALSLERRKFQAKDLLAGLESLVVEHQRLHPHEHVETMILAHSHGGNVALHMADWIIGVPKVHIDHLFMLGTPMHGDTQHHATSPLFKNVYNIHSSGDYVQVADILSTKKYVPARVIKHEAVLSSPKVKQILVEVGSYSPNHGELWFFRRPDVIFFRAGLPSAPIPVAAFVPLILREIKKTTGSEHFLKLTIDPSKGSLQVCLVPFQNYWNNELVKFHQYESRFDFSTLYSQLPIILNE